jgi:hypothetical protein
MSVKVGSDICAGTGKVEIGNRPARGGRLARENISRNAISRKAPHANSVGSPIHSINAATGAVPGISVRGRLRGISAAPSVPINRRITICGRKSRGLISAGDFAARRRVQSNVIDGIQIDTLDDIDFAARGPIVEIRGPESGPGSAGRGGEMGKVGEDEDLGVGIRRLETKGLSAVGGNVGGI